MSATFSHISSERKLPGWQVSKPFIRKILTTKGNVPGKLCQTHTEVKSKDVRCGNVRKVLPYENKLMSPWQRGLAKAINQGHNVIVDSVTSTGKTWAANLIVAHETLERDNHTRALIISPNSEIIRDSSHTINTYHNKVYQYSGVMLSSMTRNYVTYESKYGPTGQIVVVSVDSVIEFLTDPTNEGFVRDLRFVVFDEVHLKSMSESLWWTQFIPHKAQLILLSATLGNPEDVRVIVDRMQALQVRRPRETSVISYYVRPIPLQLVMFKGCEMPKSINSKSLKAAGRLSCAISTDPTERDIKSIKPDIVIPEDRESQYVLGQKILTEFPDIIKEKNDAAMKEIVTDPTPQNILSLLCYLFSNDMQPVMVFHTTTEQTRYAAEQLIGLLNRIESEDSELKEAKRACERYDKEMLRSRDKKATAKGGKGRERDMDDWNKAMPEEDSSMDIGRMRKKLNKWCFPCELDAEEIPDNIEYWIKACLDRGIGVYVATMPVWVRHYMFDAFQNGKIKVLMSDSTISVGINLPIRTCVLCGHIPHHLYKQASGRAGRRGMDTKGFIVHLMPEDRIRQYISARSVDISIQLPEVMTYSGLIRLQVPANLDSQEEPDPSQPSSRISLYKSGILNAYKETLGAEGLKLVLSQLDRINEESWTYHRLTNFIKTLPCSESMLIIKLMSTGILHQFEPTEFIDLMALLFYRKEQPEDVTDEDKESYYVPTFPRFPELIGDLRSYIEHYGLNIELDRPIHHYLNQFCCIGRQYLNFLEEIQDMGEWLYIFKRGVAEMAPKNSKNEHIDMFAQLIIKVDSIYLAAVTRKKILED